LAEITVEVLEVAGIDLANNNIALRSADVSLRTIDVKNPDN
jgi:hypothetical protein